MGRTDVEDHLVSPAWLAERLRERGSQAPASMVVVDMRWREDGSGRERYAEAHIPTAVFCDWATDLVDPDHPVAFMLAPPERFAGVMERMGAGDDTTVVAYADAQGSGPFRLWWACRMYGHDQVRVLDGGFAAWVEAGFPLESGAPASPVAGGGTVTGGGWTPRPPRERMVATADDVMGAGDDPSVVVLDSRPGFQFRGEAVWFETGAVNADPDGIARTPRGDLRAGRVPWALNVPASDLYRDDGRLKGPEELRELLSSRGVPPTSRAITYCGVGISASALLFALRRAGVDDVRLYDASWEEWGRDAARPVVR